MLVGGRLLVLVLKLKLILKPQERQDELAKVLLRVLSGQSHSNDSYWAQRQRVIKLCHDTRHRPFDQVFLLLLFRFFERKIAAEIGTPRYCIVH